MKPVILRALLIAVGTTLATLVGVAIASASAPVTAPIVLVPSGPVHAGEQVLIEAYCPTFTVVNQAPVYDTIAQLKWGSHTLWHLPTTPPKAPEAPQECVATDGGCAFPDTGICTGPVLNQVPAVFWVSVPKGASGKITAIDPYGDVIAEGTVAGSTPAKPTVPTGTTPTTTTTTKPAKPTSPKTTTPHVTSPTRLPWWRSLLNRLLGWF